MYLYVTVGLFAKEEVVVASSVELWPELGGNIIINVYPLPPHSTPHTATDE